jgi:hypothetical protein
MLRDAPDDSASERCCKYRNRSRAPSGQSFVCLYGERCRGDPNRGSALRADTDPNANPNTYTGTTSYINIDSHSSPDCNLQPDAWRSNTNSVHRPNVVDSMER